MKDITQPQKINHLKVFLIFLALDLLAIFSYLGFETLLEINSALSKSSPEIIINEVSFYTFIALFMPVIHLLIILNVYTPLSKQPYKATFNKIYMIFTLGIAIFSGYFVSIYVENKLEASAYHFCKKLSYDENIRGATHYVWRAKSENCDANIKTQTLHKF